MDSVKKSRFLETHLHPTPKSLVHLDWLSPILSLEKNLEDTALYYRGMSSDLLAQERLEKELAGEREEKEALLAQIENSRKISAEFLGQLKDLKENVYTEIRNLACECRKQEEENKSKEERLASISGELERSRNLCRDLEAQQSQEIQKWKSENQSLEKKNEDLEGRIATLIEEKDSKNLKDEAAQAKAHGWKRFLDWWSEPVTVISLSL